MKSYEATFLFDPVPEAVEQGKTSLLDIFSKLKIDSTKEQDIGRRALAYPIAGNDHAHYVLYEIDTEPENIAPLNQAARLVSPLLRSFVICRDKTASKPSATGKA